MLSDYFVQKFMAMLIATNKHNVFFLLPRGFDRIISNSGGLTLLEKVVEQISCGIFLETNFFWLLCYKTTPNAFKSHSRLIIKLDKNGISCVDA